MIDPQQPSINQHVAQNQHQSNLNIQSVVIDLFDYYSKMRKNTLTESMRKEISEKFNQVQKQIIEVVQFRKDLENTREINKIKYSHVNRMHELYEKNKECEKQIFLLSKCNKQLSGSILEKSVQISQLKNKIDLIQEKMMQCQNCTEEIRNNKTVSQKKKNHKSDLRSLTKQLNNLKNLVEASNDKQSLPLTNSTQKNSSIAQQTFLQKVINSKSQHLSKLNMQCQNLKQNYQLRQQMLQLSSNSQEKYISSQFEVVKVLMQQVERWKNIAYQSRKKLLSYRDRIIPKVEQSQKNYSNSSDALVQELQKEILKLAQSERISKIQVQRAIQQANSYQIKLKSSQQQIKQMSSQIQKLVSENREVKEAINAVNDEKAVILSESAQILKNAKQLQSNSTAQTRETKSQIQLLECRIQTLEKENALYKQELEKFVSVRQNLAEQTKKVQKLQKINRDLNAKIQNLTVQFQKNKKQLQIISKNEEMKIKQNLDKFNQHNHSLAEISKNYEKLQNNHNNLKQKSNFLQVECQSLKSQNSKMQLQLSTILEEKHLNNSCEIELEQPHNLKKKTSNVYSQGYNMIKEFKQNQNREWSQLHQQMDQMAAAIFDLDQQILENDDDQSGFQTPPQRLTWMK